MLIASILARLRKSRGGVAWPLHRRLQGICSLLRRPKKERLRIRGIPMAWTTPVLVEICIGLEINGYLPPEF